MKKIIVATLVSLLLLVGCDLFVNKSDSKYSNINILLPSSRALVDSVGSYELTISGSDFQDIVVVSAGGSISVNVLVGKNRTFTLELYDEEDNTVLLGSGETTVDLLSTEATTVNIAIERIANSITYHGFSGVDATPISDTHYYDTDSLVTVLSNPWNSEYGSSAVTYFWGWHTSENELTIMYNTGDDIEIDGGDIDLYPVWKAAEPLTVAYDLNGGAGVVPTDSKLYVAGEAVTFPDASEFSYPNKYFKGWATSSTGGPKESYTISVTNVTFYAVWSDIPVPVSSYPIELGDLVDTTLSGSFGSASGTNIGSTIEINEGRSAVLALDGIDDNVEIIQGPNPFLGDFTISLWVKFNSVDKIHAIISKDVNTGYTLSQYTEFNLWLNEQNKLELAIGNTKTGSDSWHLNQGTTVLSAGDWNHVAINFVNETTNIYVNGQLDNSLAYPDTFERPSGSLPLTIGTSDDVNLHTDTQFLDGSLDDIQIYNSGLSASEITYIYNTQK